MLSRRLRPAPRRGRPAFTLVELMIVIVLLGFVGGTLVTVINRQQRFYQGTADLIDVRGQVRQGFAVLPADLRGISTAGSDISFLSDSAIEFRSTFGSSIVCTRVNNTTVDLPPLTLAGGTTLTNWLATPEQGDTLFAYEVRTRQWLPSEIAAVTTTKASCMGPPFTNATLDAARDRYRVVVTAPINPEVTSGAPVRFVRRVRYSLYKAGDNQWYLGYNVRRPAGWGTVQPVSGPYLPYAGTGASGLRLRYFDNAMAPVTALADVPRIARMQVTFHGRSDQAWRGGWGPESGVNDSLTLPVAIRNNR